MRIVLSRVRIRVPEKLGELVVSRRETGAHDGSQPVNPMVAGEFSSGDAGAEGAGWVEGAAGEVHAWMVGRKRVGVSFRRAFGFRGGRGREVMGPKSIHTGEFGHEQGESDGDGGDEGGFLFLGG